MTSDDPEPLSRPDPPAVSGRRRTGRVLPLHGGSVLLMRGGDPARPEAGQWWFTLGGGCEPGESTVDAARREAFEEAGLVLPDDLGPPVLQRESAFAFDGAWLDQTEDYYCCAVGSADVVTDGWTELEQRSVTGLRWWTLAELQSTAETVYPPGLADLLAALLAPQGRPGGGVRRGGTP